MHLGFPWVLLLEKHYFANNASGTVGRVGCGS